MDSKEQKAQLAERAGRIQDLLLSEFEALLTVRSDELTSTDRATIARYLLANGFTVNPDDLPKELEDIITDKIEFDDDDILPMGLTGTGS